MIDLRQYLESEIEKIGLKISDVAKERDESATPMESAHDQTRQIANQLYNSLLEERHGFVLLRGVIKEFKKLVDVQDGTGKKFTYIIVPDGLGGKRIDGIVTVGEKSELGKVLKNAQTNTEYEINKVKYVITQVYFVPEHL